MDLALDAIRRLSTWALFLAPFWRMGITSESLWALYEDDEITESYGEFARAS